MRMIPIDIVVKLSVCATDFDEAVDAARRGMRAGRYADDAEYRYAADAAVRKTVKRQTKGDNR